MNIYREKIQTIRKMKSETDIINAILGIFFLIFILSLIDNKYKKITFVICLVLIILLFLLDLKFALKIEKGENKILRVNNKKFKKNPWKELYRYVNDVTYYNNIWRISFVCSLVICILFIPILDIKYIKYIPYISLILFCIIYMCWNWKIHHSYDFIFKTVKHISNYMEVNKTGNKYKQIIHI